MKGSWIILLLWIIEIFILINNISGEELNFTYPNKVIFGEVFEVNLTLINFTEGVYDIKIDITNSSNKSERLSEIYDENEISWHSTFNYVNEIINNSYSNSSTFKLNITKEFNGTANITIKIKEKKDNIINQNYQINISMPKQSSEPENNTPPIPEEAEPYIEIYWDEEDIINQEEFEIKIKAYNLEDTEYYLKVWIEFEDNDTIISDRYDEENDEWKSGYYKVYDFFTKSGNNTKKIKLKIKEKFDDFKGDAIIYAKIDNVEEINKNIKILKKKEEEPEEENKEIINYPKEENISMQSSPAPITANVIKLGQGSLTEKTEDLKEQGDILYQSKTQLIKNYAIYVFAFFCLILCCLLIGEKIK